MSFKIEITYATILDQTKKLSAFEGREATGASGESLYESILITEQDDDLINDYMHQALGCILQKIGRMISKNDLMFEEQGGSEPILPGPGYESEDAIGEEWTLRESGYDCARFGRSLNQHIREAACAYIMKLWLSDKSQDRSAFYDALYNNMLHHVCQNIYSRTISRPNYDKDENS